MGEPLVQLLSLALLLLDAERLLFRAYLFALVVHLVHFSLRAGRLEKTPQPPAPASWPRVTVQLCIAGEKTLASRVISAAAALRYPRGRLQLQVLDDSDDADTRNAVDAAALEVGAEVVRRGHRAGAKAGNLAHGLSRATGELIAVFDADFVPPPEFLEVSVPHLVADPSLALVQWRTGFMNRAHSLFNRTQAMLLDGLTAVEQGVRSARGRPLHFNGSAGLWRRSAIEGAGGWSPRTVAEDLDLSLRVQLLGGRLLHLWEREVPSELARDMAALRIQQRRWAEGKAAVFVHNVRALFSRGRREGWPLRARVDALTNLGSRLIHPLLLVLTVSMPLTTFDLVNPPLELTVLQDSVILGLLLAGVGAYYGRALELAGQRAREVVVLGPLLVALIFGLSITCTLGLVRGLLPGSGRFERTAKPGEVGRPRVEPTMLLEVATGAAYVVFSGIAASRGYLPAAGFFAFVAAAYLWVGGGALSCAWGFRG